MGSAITCNDGTDTAEAAVPESSVYAIGLNSGIGGAGHDDNEASDLMQFLWASGQIP